MEYKYYAGVGSRQTPPHVLRLMIAEARRLAKLGWTLRSGHAQGADRAFEEGARGRAEIMLPWPSFGQRPYGDDPGAPVVGKAICHELSWDLYFQRLVHHGLYADTPRRSLRLLHGRNVAQVQGAQNGDEASRFVLYWCEEKGGQPQGGTATAVKLAQLFNIQTFNLWRPDVYERVRSKHEGV